MATASPRDALIGTLCSWSCPFGGAGSKFKTNEETFLNFGWFFSVGLTKCSISAIVNSLKEWNNNV